MTHLFSTPGYLALMALQRRIHAFTVDAAAELDGDIDRPDLPLWTSVYQYLAIAPLHGGLHVEFFGDIWSEPFEWTLACLARQDVADTLVSLAFTGPDEGANGTREWEFTPLLDSGVQFPRLRFLSIRPTAPEDHNTSLIVQAGSIMEEGGEIARFAAKAPYLTDLVVPNAPDAAFFQVPLPQLSMLRIGGGSDTQGFIDNLAASRNLPALGLLDFTESTELQFTWAHSRPADAVTPFAAYERLFASPALDPVHSLRLRNTCLSLEELQALGAMRPSLQFMVMQATQGGYVSHFAQNVFPWQHLVQADPGRQG
ncbi:hypothetical protein [Achromobacter sp. UMC46]|uniref:hypothetical protein n=1 Tax=Achromobacter sp. UMC46 TaxID=1862319 RepID=UPI001602BFC1|nr:hypothetical protein [Achromobacter sp. UMC46]MBB1594377.1 hypothetical protein [Achromobacter sp. UMC46]